MLKPAPVHRKGRLIKTMLRQSTAVAVHSPENQSGSGKAAVAMVAVTTQGGVLLSKY